MFEFLKRLRFATKHAGTLFQTVMFPQRGEVIWTASTYESLSHEGYEVNDAVYSVINEISSAWACIPWVTKDKATEEIIKDHPATELMKRPNEFQGGTEFRESVMGYLLIDGNTYIKENRPFENEGPAEMFTIQPNMIKLIAGTPQQPISGWKIQVGPDSFETVGFEEVMHSKLFSPRNRFLGLSPIAVASRSVDQSNQAKIWNVSLLQNSAAPSGALGFKQAMSTEQFDAWKEKLRTEYQGSRNAGIPMVLGGDPTWMQFGLSPKDMDWLNITKTSARSIFMIYNTPPEIMGDGESKTFANYKEARLSFYDENIIPKCVRFKDHLNIWLVPKFPDGDRIFMDFDLTDISALKQNMNDLFKRMAQATWLTDNEKRLETGFEERDSEELNMTGAERAKRNSDDLAEQLKLGGNNIGNPKPNNPKDKKEFKFGSPFKLENQYTRDIYAKQFDSNRDVFEPLVTDIIRRRFNDEKKRIINALDESATPDAIMLMISERINEDSKRWLKTLTNIWIGVAETFAQNTFMEIKGIKKGYETKQTIEETVEGIRSWVLLEGLKQVVRINTHTKNILKKIVVDSVGGGGSILQVRTEIQGLIDAKYLQQNIQGNRASVIAKTEIIRASNRGSQEGAKAVGIPLKKTWVTIGDNRVREKHVDVNGQTRPLKEPYNVGGDLLMYPGDSDLGAKANNVIQCRCIEVYEDIGEE